MMNRKAGKNPLSGCLLKLFITIMHIAVLSAAGDALTIEYNLIIPKKKIFIGEKINFELRFRYPANLYLRLRSIQDPEIPGISQLKITGPQVAEEMQNNMRVRQFTWHGSCVPDASGRLVIPALRAVYSVNFDTHELYSKPETVQVLKLPQDIDIHAMGRFKKIELIAEKKAMQAGTAQKIIINIDGVACGSVKAPKLVLPDGLKYYDSTAEVKKLAEDVETARYSFEYIVQALSPGEFKIKAQEFVFFDPDSEKYTRLTSNEITLCVTGVAAGVGVGNAVAKDACDVVFTDSQIQLAKDREPEELIAQKIEQLTKNKQTSALPWSLYILFLLIAGLPALAKLVHESYNYYWPVSYRQRRYAFRTARKNINYAAQQHDSQAVYGIIKYAVAQRCNMPDITDEIIESKLQQAGCPPEVLADWKKFSVDLLSPEFGDTSMRLDEAQVFVTARDLISRFEKIL